VIRDYVLPDYIEVKRGFVRAPEATTGKSQAGEQIIRYTPEAGRGLQRGVSRGPLKGDNKLN
jgi:hypothetical protein